MPVSFDSSLPNPFGSLVQETIPPSSPSSPVPPPEPVSSAPELETPSLSSSSQSSSSSSNVPPKPNSHKRKHKPSSKCDKNFCHEFNINGKNFAKAQAMLGWECSWQEVDAELKRRRKETGVGLPTPIAGVDGHQFSLLKYLPYYFSKKGYSVGTKEELKISIDGATMSGKSKYEVGVFEDLKQETVAKSVSSHSYSFSSSFHCDCSRALSIRKLFASIFLR
jgi:hypothetical protein